MTTSSATDRPLLSPADQEELTKLVNAVALSDRTLTLFGIAPESAPDHPVVQQFRTQLEEFDEPPEFLTFFYSDNSLFNCLAELDSQSSPSSGRRVIMAFGLEQLPTPRLKREMEQLNLAREAIFERNLVLVFWLNRESFLDEFRRRAPDFWDWRGKVAAFETRHPLLYPYLEWLIAENSYLKMSGVMQVNRQVDIFLDQIYVSLQAEWVEERSQSVQERITTGEGQVRSSSASLPKLGEPGAWEGGFNDQPTLPEQISEPDSPHRVTKIVDLAEAVREQDFSVILGDPGAGKTTLLRYLARHFAIAHRDSNSTVVGGMQEDLGQLRLPILFRIADYAERLAQQPDLRLVDYLKQFYRQWERNFEASDGNAVADLLLNKMRAGDCLLLLDGLDEVFDQSNRNQVVQQIKQLVDDDDYRANKFVITSRIAGYQEAALGNRFRVFTITPMGDAQIRQFLERWCLAIEVAQRPDAAPNLRQRDAEREAEGILRAIETKLGVKRFAANPLLLTILALIHRNGTQMPQRRVELYALATKTLIEDWQLGRNVPYGARQRQLILVEEEVTALLAPLAFRMHEEKPSGLVTQAEVEEWLIPKMEELQGVDEPAALELVRQFLRKVRETTGLFVERALAMYGFMHLTFEEYFAARYIADNDIDEILGIISPYRNQARWNEPILLALGYLSADQKRVNQLVEQLFSNLAAYQPMIAGKEIWLENPWADDPVLVWYAQPDGKEQVSDSVWQDLLFVGQVLAEVKVTPKFCRQQVEKLVLTYLGLYLGLYKRYRDEPTEQLLKLLRGIEVFNNQVLARLQQAAEDECLSEEQRNKALAAMLYVACGETGETLTDTVTALVQKLTPSLFDEIRDLVAELGAEMTSALGGGLKDQSLDGDRRRALEFMTGLSYLRSDNYDHAIARLQPLVDQADCHLNGFIHRAITIAYEESADAYYQLGRNYQASGKYEQALANYQQSRDKYQHLDKQTNVADLWYSIGECYREWGKYEQALKAQQQELALRQRLDEQENIALAYWRVGRIYQAWGKYDQALANYQQSRDKYQHLDKQTNVADLWYSRGECYREWGKYQQALKAQQQELTLRQKLDEQSNIARAYWRVGRIYQAWGKYTDALTYYQQSRELYQHLGKETDVTNLWDWIGDCYREWGNYEQALEVQQQNLALRQKLDEQSNIANVYYQLGRIYQAWGKYAQAIAHHEQSRDLYQQLGKETNIANLWNWIGECYREWGKYEQALEAQQQNLALRQKLDEQSNIANAYNQLGRIYQAWGKYAQAIAHYEQSRDLYQQLGKETNVANQWYWMAECYREWGKYEQALAAAQQDLATRQRLDDQPNIAHAYFQLGYIYQAWGKYTQAITYYEQSRDLYQQLEQPKAVASRWYNLAECYREWGKYEQALESQQHCLEIRQTLDDPSLIAVTYYQLGRIYQAWGKYTQAIAHYQQSRDKYQQLGKQTDVADLWYWIGECYREWGKYEQALEAQQQKLTLRQKLDEQSNIALAYYHLGSIYQAWGKYEQAIAHYQQSRDKYQHLGKETDVANLCYWIGDCYRERGKYELAIKCQQQCLELRRLEEEQSRVALSLAQMGGIYQAWGKYEEAIAHYQQSRDLYQHLGREKDVSYRWYNLAECYREWGKYEQALECEQKDLELCQRLDFQSDIALSYYQLGRIYQAWGKYEQALTHHQQSRDLYQQLERPKSVARQWYYLAECYRDWGKYQQALESQQQYFELCQTFDNEWIASAHHHLGRIYQAWGKYTDAITHYQQSRDLYASLGLQLKVANLLSSLADCYRESKDYTTAIEYYQNSFERYQALEHNENAAKPLRQLSSTQRQLAKICSHEEATALLQQAEHHLQQANQLDTTGDYRKNLAYDHIAFALLFAEQLRWRLEDDAAEPEQIAQFEQAYATGFAYLTELGQVVDNAEEALDIARAYLEISPLENLERAEALAHQSLQTFQDFNRRQLEASAYKLLGEIYLARAHHQESGAIVTASQFLTASLHLYRELDLTEKAAEVEQLMTDS